MGESREQRDAARSWQAGVVRYTYACKHFEKMGESVLNWKFLYLCSHSERLELAHLHLDTVVWEITLVKIFRLAKAIIPMAWVAGSTYLELRRFFIRYK